MSSEVCIRTTNLGKAYAIFNRPQDRLKQMLSLGRRTYYREFWALRDVNLEISEGEIVGVIGSNGSGKSTLLQLICGNLSQTSGEIVIRGRISALLELGAGFNPEFSGRENVFVNAAIMGYTEDEITERYDSIAAFADIGEFIDQPVKTYSSGMYTRLAFAVAISVEPDILLVDEALAVGDEAFQRKCYARIEQIRKRGGTVLFVSHSAGAIVELCDRAVLLHTGERLFTGAPKTAIGLYQKLLNAPREYTDQIRAEIREHESATGSTFDAGDSRAEQRRHAGEENLHESNPLDEPASKSRAIAGQAQAVFDTNLISQSAVIYPPNGAEIRNPRILTIDGQTVNSLVTGERYRICYDVHFTQHCADVRFFTNIRTVTGVPLGGGTYPQTGTHGIGVRSGQHAIVEFEFNCLLNAGTYFVNCQIRGKGERSLHRIVDATIFRVQSRNHGFSFGNVDFLYSPQLRMEAT